MGAGGSITRIRALLPVMAILIALLMPGCAVREIPPAFNSGISGNQTGINEPVFRNVSPGNRLGGGTADSGLNQICSSDSDCTLFICSGCYNKEWARTAPPDLACVRYSGYACRCIGGKCIETK